VRAVLSEPSTGAVGAQEVGRLVGVADLITFDMGGTSTDVALLQGGARPPACDRGQSQELPPR
jgi:N-methylhydantoinase A